nr:hypothetical protein [Anaerolineae bacterium]
MRQKFFLLTLLAVLLMSIMPTLAQDGIEASVLVEGLDNPRGINFDENGVLFIAESGTGGTTEMMGPFGPATLGFTGQVSVFAEGELSVLIDYL